MPWAIGDRIENSGTIIGIGRTKAGALRYLVERDDNAVLVHTDSSLLAMYKPKIILGPKWRDAGYEKVS